MNFLIRRILHLFSLTICKPLAPTIKSLLFVLSNGPEYDPTFPRAGRERNFRYDNKLMRNA